MKKNNQENLKETRDKNKTKRKIESRQTNKNLKPVDNEVQETVLVSNSEDTKNFENLNEDLVKEDIKASDENLAETTTIIMDDLAKIDRNEKEVDIIKAKEPKAETKKKSKKELKNKKQNTDDRPKASRGVFIGACITSTIVGLGILACIIGGTIGLIMLKDKPDLVLSDLIAPESTVVYDASGDVISELGQYKRENVEYSEIPNVLVDAFLSIEDSRFFEHFGFDIPRFTKAILANLQTRSFGQGGSTFDMQLIKNTYFQVDNGDDSTVAEKKVSRKVQEIVLAIEADAKIDKRDILATYLNRINYGNNIRGIQKASQYYFGKNVNDLDLSESAFLAGLINSPNACNPYNNLIKDNENNIYVNKDFDYLAYGTQRRNEVLDMMVYHGYITQMECDLAKSIKLEDQLIGHKSVWNDSNPYYQSYIDAAIQEAIDLTGLDPTTTAMKIYTNMDPYMQQLVYDIQNSNDIINWYRDDVQNAIVSMNNQTGAIVAIGGGRFQSGALNWNRATMSKIQPGSTVKPIFEYLLAFEELGWSTAHTLTDRPIYLYGSDHLITNASGTYDGDMLITEAVARSLNTPAIQTLQALIDKKGEQYCIDYLKSIGLEFNEDTFDLQYAIGGNTMQVSPVNLAGMHSILFNGGYYIEPHTISRVELNDGTVIEEDTYGNQVVSSAAAYLAAQLEYEVVYGNFYNYTQILKDDYPVFAKTGTTDWGNSGVAYGIPVGSAKDSWLVCSTSNYTNVIWLGFDKVANGTYFTSNDDRINIKGQIGNILIDEGIKHFNYKPTSLERPSDVVEITHVKGLFPYIEPVVGEPVTGLIKKEFYSLAPVSDIQYEYRSDALVGIEATQYGSSIDVSFIVADNTAPTDMQDLTARSNSGKVTTAYGRLYYPRIIYTGGTSDSSFYAELIVNGRVVASDSSYSPYISFSYDGNIAGSGQVCGGYSNGTQRACVIIKESPYYDYDDYYDYDWD